MIDFIVHQVRQKAHIIFYVSFSFIGKCQPSLLTLIFCRLIFRSQRIFNLETGSHTSDRIILWVGEHVRECSEIFRLKAAKRIRMYKKPNNGYLLSKEYAEKIECTGFDCKPCSRNCCAISNSALSAMKLIIRN